MKSPFRIGFLLLAGCNTSSIQTTSGRAYLNDYPEARAAGALGNVEEDVRVAASVEPTLTFPVRIGLAKIVRGEIANPSAEELEAWGSAAQRLGPGFGTFVPLSPLLAESVYRPSSPEAASSKAAEVLRKIRLGSARQHLDAVLVYETFSESKSTQLATAVADWTLIGAYFVPSKEIETTGFANALLIDVRSGYPYGIASASLSAEDRAATLEQWDIRRNLEAQNEFATVLHLIPEVESMVASLQQALPGTH